MSSTSARLLESTPSTLKFADREVLKPKRQDQERNQRSGLLPETDLRLAELRMSLLFPPIQPEGVTVAEVEDSEHAVC